ncbi:MAG TPA: hypothetical protein VIG06_12835 [Kofleriaceae bacterium]|jgi:hypothetical protein
MFVHDESLGGEKTSGFEVVVAVLIGLGALGGAWASYQANQWGSTSTEKYGHAATTATKGATLFNLGVSTASRDSQLDIQGKELVLRAVTAKNPLDKERDLTIAKYLYTRQMSDEAYASLGYPAEFRTEDDDKASSMPEEVLVAGLDRELDEKYLAAMLGGGTQRFGEADKVFQGGQTASGISTRFGINGLFFTITLFLGGVSLVFKSRVRWVFLMLGFLSLALASGYLFTLDWF